MPVLKHAKKKQRKDKKRTLKNKQIRDLYKKLIKKARVSKKAEDVSKAFSQIDKAAKNNVIHENKAARLKASLTKALQNEVKPAKLEKETKPKTPVVKPEKTAKTTKSKASTKKSTKKLANA